MSRITVKNVQPIPNKNVEKDNVYQDFKYVLSAKAKKGPPII